MAATTTKAVDSYVRVLVAVLSAAAGLIHFAAAGDHFGLSWYHGVFFAVVGWLQIAWAALVLRRQLDPRVLLAGAMLNVGVLAVWAMSRTVGVPVGPGSWTRESAGFVDLAIAAFEVVIVAVLFVLVRQPRWADRPVEVRTAGLAVVGVTAAVIAVSTTAVSPSFASHDHAAGGHGAGGHDHGEVVIQADGTSECERAGVTNAGNSANGGHGHRGPVPSYPLDDETRAELSAQLAEAADVARRYPTVADAEAGGYTRASVYVPCIAAHYLSDDARLVQTFDPSHPPILLFAGTEPDSPLVGMSYGVTGEDEPEGFAGPNDVWHAHSQLCVKGGDEVEPARVIGTEGVTREECEAQGGGLMDTSRSWMMHLWNVPGWENRWGMFASEHPDLGGRMGDPDAPPDPNADNRWFEQEVAATAG